jgi:simple sugar transport system substrate-binding protein/basic membrane protein A
LSVAGPTHLTHLHLDPNHHKESSNMRTRRILATAIGATMLLVGAACSSNDGSADASGDDTGGDTSSSEAPGKDSPAVGFIMVGPKDDFGYNQAVYEGAMAVEEAYPDLEVLTAENVPETDEAARVMEGMIDDGAKIIFATSFGHLDAALTVAEENPDVVVVHQGGTVEDEMPPNFGTYFGTVYEPVYLAGILAGAATESNKLGYVYAFPIPQTIANINAFQLGAASVNPDVETFVVNTSNWCDPAAQAQAASSLLGQGVDVLTQHQDCTATITKAAEDAGAFVVGYHADASELAPEGWLGGSEWDWDALYIDLVEVARAGDFTGSKYNANYRVGYKDGLNPFIQSEFGPSVTDETKALVEEALERISTTGSPFEGPILANDGTTVLFEDGEIGEYDTAEGKNSLFVEGVVGEIPES